MTTYTWNSGAPGNWNVSGNWTPVGFPDSASSGLDSVVISVGPFPYTITYNVASSAIANFSQTSSASTLKFLAGDTLTVNTGFSQTAGTITVGAAAALLQINAAAAVGGHLNITNAGTVNVAGVLSLAATGSIDVNAGSLITSGLSVAAGGIVNLFPSALLAVTGSGSINWSNLTKSTGGTIEADGGTLLILGTTTVSASTPALLVSNAATSVLQFGAAQTGDTITFAGAAGDVTVASGTTFSSGTLVGLNAGVSTTVATNYIDYLGTAITITGGANGTGTTGALGLSNGTSLTLSGITGATTWTANAVSDGAGGTEIFLSSVCYAAGTQILTATGERPVESLMAGDMVLTLSGDTLDAQPVKWIGRRRIDIAEHPRPEIVAPILIQRGAFADATPHRDLLVSPDHAILVDGTLICARQLVNGTTIRQDMAGASVEYFHVELDSHAILLAEGLPAESYLDTGNRGFFINSGEPLVLHPDLTDEQHYPAREAASCAPFVWDDASVRPIWQRLADRAAILGRPVPVLDTTTDLDLCIVVGGRTLQPLHVENGLHVFALPAATTGVRIISRAAAPTDARPWSEDRRLLGAYVTRIVVRDGDDVQDVPVDHPSLTQGWWAVERDGMALNRWTNGDAALPLTASNRPAILEIRAGSAGLSYLTATEQRRAA